MVLCFIKFLNANTVYHAVFAYSQFLNKTNLSLSSLFLSGRQPPRPPLGPINPTPVTSVQSSAYSESE